MSEFLRVIKSGLFTTVQDLGRNGYQQYGMVVSGAMDPFALRVGNLLVGNKQGEAGLEITLIGPELEVLDDCVMAICGADLSPALDGEPIPVWKSFRARKGQFLRFGTPKKGVRAYLTVAGGFDVPAVMGSKSTYVKASIGGLEGRPLRSGDILRRGESRFSSDQLEGRGLLSSLIPDYPSHLKVRVVLGPDEDLFLEEGVETFLSETYEITPQSDRMGYRLKGATIKHKEGADIISDAIAPGTIQIPSSGQPIILLADRQTTGGYARIGTVISVDIPLIAQMVPGNRLSFEAVSVEEAQRLYLKQERLIKKLSIASGIL